jgi:hypothetical protein
MIKERRTENEKEIRYGNHVTFPDYTVKQSQEAPITLFSQIDIKPH